MNRWIDNNWFIRLNESKINVDNFLVEDTDFLDIDNAWLIEYFNKFNHKYFKDSLPDINFIIEENNTQGGSFEIYSNKKYANCSFNEIPTGDINIIIRVSKYYKKTEKEYCEVLLHEMIHCYMTLILENYNVNKEHTDTFIEFMKNINDYGWDISEISIRKPDRPLYASAFEKLKNSCMLSTKVDSTKSLMILTSLEKALNFKNADDGGEIRLFKVKDPNSFKDWTYVDNVTRYLIDMFNKDIPTIPYILSNEKIKNYIESGKLEEISSKINESINTNETWLSFVKKQPTYKELHLPNGEILYGYVVHSSPEKPEIIARGKRDY